VNLVSPNYGTPLLFACQIAASDDVIDLLLQSNARLGLTETQSAGELCRAVLEGDVRLLRRLLRCNIRPVAKGCDSRTALHVAATGGFPAAVAVLLQAGCPPDVQDRWGTTPLDEARRANNSVVLACLEAHVVPRQAV
jgi:ankyrin repeat protein